MVPNSNNASNCSVFVTTSGVSGGKNVKSAYFVPPATPYKLFMCITNNLCHLYYFCTYLKGGLPSKLYAHWFIKKVQSWLLEGLKAPPPPFTCAWIVGLSTITHITSAVYSSCRWSSCPFCLRDPELDMIPFPFSLSWFEVWLWQMSTFRYTEGLR